MSRNAFPAIEREYADKEAMRDIDREERKRELEDLEVLRKRKQHEAAIKWAIETGAKP